MDLKEKMRKIFSVNHCLLLASLILISSSAFAQPLKIFSTKSGTRYMTGGIGEEDVAVMRRHAKQFTLNLLLSEGSSGRWVTDANVNIYDEASNLVFRMVAAKPMLYVNLPAGTYTILANNNGQKLRHKFKVAAINQRIILNWKDSLIEEDMPLDGEGH